jgi:hypothetical protein
LRVRTESPKTYSVTLVTMAEGIDIGSIADDLNKIYKPFEIKWEVTVDKSMEGNIDWDVEGEVPGQINTGDAFLSEYSDDQKMLHSVYKSSVSNFDASRSYVFLFNNQVEAAPGSGININDAVKLGDMPINRRWGYLFGGNPDARTLAHELGHGRLTLRHTFADEHCKCEPGHTNNYNLMDYVVTNPSPLGGGWVGALNRFQWETAHNPAPIGKVFQDDEDGAMVGDDLLSVLTFIESKKQELSTDNNVFCIAHKIEVNNNATGFTYEETNLPANQEGVSFLAQIPNFKIHLLFLDDVEQGNTPDYEESGFTLPNGISLFLKDGTITNCDNTTTQLDQMLASFSTNEVSIEYTSLLLEKAIECFFSAEYERAFSGHSASLGGFTSFNLSDFEIEIQALLNEDAFANVKMAARIFTSNGSYKTLFTKGVNNLDDAELECNYYFDYATNTMQMSIVPKLDYLKGFEPNVTALAARRGQVVNAAAMRAEILSAIPNSIDHAINISEFQFSPSFNRAVESLRFGQVLQLNVKSIWQTGNLHRGTWHSTDPGSQHNKYPAYARLDPVSTGAIDAAAEEVVGYKLLFDMICEMYSNSEMRNSVKEMFTTKEGLVSLRESLVSEFGDILNDTDKQMYYPSKATVQVGIFIATGGLKGLTQLGKSMHKALDDVASLANKFSGSPKISKYLDDLKQLGESGLSKLNNMADVAKKFTDPKNLEAIYNRLGDNFSKFIDDLASDPNLIPFFDYDGGGLVEAWEAVSKHANIRKHIPSLEKVSDLLNDADFIGKLPNGKADLDAIIDAVKNPLDGGTASKLVKLSDHLENVKQVVKKHSGADGFDRLMTDLKNPAFAMQDGTTHMLNDVKNMASDKVKKFDYEFDGDGVACTRCRFDVELDASSGDIRLIEYKSWSLENIPNLSTQQMKEYFGAVDNISEMKYVFNKLKTPDLGAVRTQMKSVLSDNAPDIFQRMKTTLKLDLGADNLPDFMDLVNNTESKLYNFIDIK